MGEVLFDLEQVLRTKQERLTPAEAKVLLTYKSKAIREFTAGALVGSGVTWLATRRLNKIFRLNLSGGAAIVCGFWSFGRSLESAIDSILGVDGSRLQKELANIIVTKYQDDPWRMRLISKHFYSEKVYDDSTSDQPKLRWRYKNYFSDNVAQGQRTHETDSYGDSHTDSHNNSHNDFQNDSGSKKNDLESKKVLVKPDVDVVMDPLDCVFGNTATTEEIHHPNTSSTPTRVLTRNHKRSHRRRRMRHNEGSLDPHYA